MSTVIESLGANLENEGYAAKDVFAVERSLEEAITNAIKHGHQGDPTRPVWVSFYVDEAGVDIQVEDEGEGFDPSQVLDRTLPENADRASGRGLLLMQHYMNRVCHNERGNCVCFCKLRPGAPELDPGAVHRPCEEALFMSIWTSINDLV
jgi:serine/threonine-protein kinase RsbW